MFEGMAKNGEDTPLNHIPKTDFSFKWYMEAYSTLSHSVRESGALPLSELKIYEEKFGLIGSFSEFTKVIYEINNLYAKKRIEKMKNHYK